MFTSYRSYVITIIVCSPLLETTSMPPCDRWSLITDVGLNIPPYGESFQSYPVTLEFTLHGSTSDQVDITSYNNMNPLCTVGKLALFLILKTLDLNHGLFCKVNNMEDNHRFLEFNLNNYTGKCFIVWKYKFTKVVLFIFLVKFKLGRDTCVLKQDA